MSEGVGPSEEALAKDVAAHIVDTVGVCIGADKVFWPEIWRGQITVALDAFAARAVAAERERCLRIIREEFAQQLAAAAKAKGPVVHDFFASLTAVIRRGER